MLTEFRTPQDPRLRLPCQGMFHPIDTKELPIV